MEGHTGRVSTELDGTNSAGPTVRWMVWTLVVSVAVLVLDALTPLGLAVWLLQVVLVWVAALWAGRRQMLALTAIGATFILLGFWLSSRAEPVTWVDLCNVVLSLGTVSMLAHSRLRQLSMENARRKAEQEAAQAQETVRILHGLLSICAWCRKIRNEAGDWEQLESYISSHSDAEFTHAMCHECAARLKVEATAPHSG